MKKCYLFLMMLFVQLIMSGGAFAADPPKEEYDAALAAITAPAYYIYTEVDGVKYYLTSAGDLTDVEENRYLYAVSQVSGGALYDIGWLLDPGNGAHYSNTTLVDSKANLHPGTGVYRQDPSNNRNDWERQVLYMNEEGLIAIRSCNTAFGESSWADAGRAFWTYEVEEVDEGVFEVVYNEYDCPEPCYSYEPAYIWQFEEPTVDAQIYNVLGAIYNNEIYEDLMWDDKEEPLTLNMGTDFGQYRDWESWYALWDLLQVVLDLYENDFDPETGEWIGEGEKPTLEQVQEMSAQADALYQAIINSEIPYSLPNGDGYYRIKSILRYFTNNVTGQDEYGDDIVETSYVDKVLLASYENMGMFGTLKENMANQVWKLTQKGDSILMQNVGMESFISATETPGGDNRIHLTEDAADAAYVVFDWAGTDYLDESEDVSEKETFNIRLNSKARHAGNYAHQNGHNKGADALKDLQVSFWYSTYGKTRYTDDGGTSEWYLEPSKPTTSWLSRTTNCAIRFSRL